MKKINIIELDQKWTECTICKKETMLKFSLPIYEREIINTTQTDEWAGMPVCEHCHNLYYTNKQP